jgi:EF hand
MRLTRFHLFLALGGSLLLLGPAISLGQPGGFPGGQPGGQPGGFPGGQPGGRQGGQPGGRQGGRQFDPNMIFNMISQGKDTIDVATYLPMAQMRDPNAADKINEFMQRMGITNGQLTRDQFAQFMQERMTQRQADRAAANPGGSATDPANPSASPEVSADGEPIPEDKRPIVYRAGNLPKDIPSWFGQMDTDRDGQVGLYEWKAQGRSVSDFQALDLNGDGFITVEEAMRTVKKSQGTAVASSASPFPGGPAFSGAPSFPGAPSFNGPPQNGNPGGQNGQRGNRGNRGNRPGRGGPPGQ